ncbi:hypothetical protein HFO58_07760 [Rhizobium leguminosarum]|uniref:hypothetical protein n=1 Tax=Rhizobium leguminosarum TaxID=384 RepID=UPI001C98A896|nr:hypothetical protein [Rhizobium leguminosarum]MBY5533065.1 hypothetical protein [Rhizobium leguminosarum]
MLRKLTIVLVCSAAIAVLSIFIFLMVLGHQLNEWFAERNTALSDAERIPNPGEVDFEKTINDASIRSRVVIQVDREVIVKTPTLITFAIQPRGRDGSTRKLDTFVKDLAKPAVMDEDVQLLPQVRASISSADLEIKEQQTGWKMLYSDRPVIWTWSATAPTEGPKTIIFVLEQQIAINGQNMIVPAEHFPFVVQVKAEMIGKVTSIFSSFQSAILAVVSVLGALGTVSAAIWKLFHFFRPRAAVPSASIDPLEAPRTDVTRRTE